MYKVAQLAHRKWIGRVYTYGIVTGYTCMAHYYGNPVFLVAHQVPLLCLSKNFRYNVPLYTCTCTCVCVHVCASKEEHCYANVLHIIKFLSILDIIHV